MSSNSNYREPCFVPAINAYYHAPPLWIGAKPTDVEIQTAPESEFIKNMYEIELSQGIRVRVRRDGVFVFDCSNWEPGGHTDIPGYDVIGGQPIPREVLESQDLAQQREYRRIQLLTVHLACIGTAFGGGMRQDLPPQPSSIITLSHFNQNDLQIFLDSFSPIESYVCNNLLLYRCNPGFRMADRLKRRISVSVETVGKSFLLLQKILDSPHKNICDLVELLYKSVYNYTIHQFSESLILCWAICESLLNIVWNQYVEDERSQVNRAGMQQGVTRINNNRKKRLEGIDFTASMKSEVLELSHRLSHDLFCNLNKVRKTRNDWLHSLKDVTDDDASHAIKTTRDFLERVTNIDIQLQIGLTLVQRFYTKDIEKLNRLL